MGRARGQKDRQSDSRSTLARRTDEQGVILLRALPAANFRQFPIAEANFILLPIEVILASGAE
jgi:hypothetical protein